MQELAAAVAVFIVVIVNRKPSLAQEKALSRHALLHPEDVFIGAFVRVGRGGGIFALHHFDLRPSVVPAPGHVARKAGRPMRFDFNCKIKL